MEETWISRDVICGRESIRSYDPTRPVDKQVLERILDAGRIAPSAANTPALAVPPRLLPGDAHPGPPLLPRSPGSRTRRTCSWSSGRTGDAWTRQDGWNSIETDLTIAMDHMILAAENEGVGTCWIAAFDPGSCAPPWAWRGRARVRITPLGYPKPGSARRARSRGRRCRKW